jgi:hypothetical protein
MRPFINLLFFLLSSLVSYCQSWHWSLQLGSEGNDLPINIALDFNDNIYAAGYYGAPPIFNWPFAIFQNDTLPIHGFNDIYLTKYGQNGVQHWAKRIGNMNNTESESAGVYSNFEKTKLYLFGSFQDSIQLDSIYLNGHYLNDIFIAQIDTSGKTLWAKKIVGPGTELAGKLDFDDKGNFMISAVTYSGAIIDTFNITPGLFYAKFDSLGNCLLVKKCYELNGSTIGTLPYYKNNKYYISGYYADTTIIDSITLISKGNRDIFIASYDENLSLIWLKSFGGIGDEQTNNIVVDDQSNIYVAGHFTDSITFDGLTYYGNGRDLFLAKFDSLGNNIWFKSILSNDDSENHMVNMVHPNNSIYICGRFSDSISFDSTFLFGAQENSFVASYSLEGVHSTAFSFDNADITNLIVDDLGNPLITGYFSTTTTMGINTFNSYGFNDIFIGKHDAITNIEDLQKVINKLNIYANPAKEEVHIVIPEDFKQASVLNLSIMDNTGRIVKEYKIDGDESLTINITTLASGMYQVLLDNNKKQYVGTLIVNRH